MPHHLTSTAPHHQSAVLITLMHQADIDPSFPIIRLAMPDVQLAAWRQYARRAITSKSPGRGILAARWHARHHPAGLACFDTRTELDTTKTLCARPVVAVDILHPDRLITALVKQLCAIAQITHCTHLSLALPQTPTLDLTTIPLNRTATVNQDYTIG
ncbi:hypothetical protein AruPA_13270 [Acidiphilium sp. PA]|uniref:hypothetical protein n=1 Tax=Acidiphilium sp. PA TaxID=2871705 RepID=UPI0022435934|nr:hypothetical protein [Acidiphilium sp. PA]MCW8308014.1 hypothetical protein [Acidiphilium sp. PA]